MQLVEFDLDLPRAERSHRFWSRASQKIQRTKPIDQLGVAVQEVAFDERSFLAADVPGRKALALATLQDGALKAAAALGWPTGPFEAAYGAVVERNYVNQWVWPEQSRWNRNRSFSAHLACDKLGKLAWLSADEVALVARDGKELVRTRVDSASDHPG